MKKVLLSSIAVLGFVTCRAQTTVSGFINSNTTWNVSGSPYIVTGNALLSNGFTLTIDPGVIVKFDSDKALQIDGQLIAIGTPSQRIKFTSNQVSPMPGDWAKLHFSDLSTDAVFDAVGNYLSGSIMKYCDITYAGSLGFSAIDIQQSSPYLNKCNISYSAASGIIYNSIDITIDSSNINNCVEYGILFQTPHYIMHADTIIANAQGGVQMWSGGMQSKILDSYFESNNTAISWAYNELASTTISGNTFINNIGNVVSLQGHFDTLLCNKFINNTGGPALFWGGSCCPSAGGLIFNNLFEGNSNSAFDGSIIEIGAGYYGGNGDTLIFSNNIFRNNSTPIGSCLIFDPYLLNYTLVEYLRIYDNIFTINSGPNLIKIRGDQNSNASYDFLYMKNNNFVNPSCQYELYNEIPYGSPNLFLDNNYWGSTSSSHIDSVIYDYFDYANQSVVYYSPFLNSPIVIDSACRPFVNMPAGISDYSGQIKTTFLIYPNPFSIQTNLQTDYFLHDGTITITNSYGQTVKQLQNISGQTTTIFRDNLPAGLYFVRLTEENKVIATGKLVIAD